MDNEIFWAIQELRKIGVIGVHEHCRGLDRTDPNDKLAQKATIDEVLKAAAALGLKVICDMPNTDPLLTSEEVLLARIGAAKKSASYGVKYMVWFGLTADPEQIAKAVYLWKKYPQIVGLKMFAGKSTGNLAIIEYSEQRIVWQTLAQLGYSGAVAVHCEKESLFKPEAFYPDRPWTWVSARPEESETESISDQVKLIKETGFTGHLHVCHVSSYESVEIIDEARKRGAKISCGITPQHLMFSVYLLKKLGRTKSLILKCNPPIREEDNRHKLLKYLKDGKIDLVETDHAPHTVKDKTQDYASGVMSLLLLPRLYIILRECGFGRQQLNNLLRENALKIFPKIKL